MIEAYCAKRSYTAGDKAEVHVSSDSKTYSLLIRRETGLPQVVLELKSSRA